jgi:hypothetical protein
MITLAEPKSELTGLSDVLLGSLGLAGVLILSSVLLAAVFSAALFWWRSRSAGRDSQPPNDLHIV